MMRTGAPFAKALIAPIVPSRNADIHTFRNHRLLRLTAALRVQEIERQPVLLEDAGALADFRDR